MYQLVCMNQNVHDTYTYVWGLANFQLGKTFNTDLVVWNTKKENQNMKLLISLWKNEKTCEDVYVISYSNSQQLH